MEMRFHRRPKLGAQITACLDTVLHITNYFLHIFDSFRLLEI